MLPFRSELDEVVRGDRSIWAKMAACAAVTTALVIGGLVKMTGDEHLNVELSAPLVAACVIGSSVAGAGLALALALKDVVRRRVGEGERVNPILRVFSGRASGRSSCGLSQFS